MWKDTVDKCVQSIVTIKSRRVRSFDTDVPGSFTATGFIVSPGLILSNRHVVSPGPVVAQAVLANDEEIPLQPIYRDPVHDFGFFRYDPSDIKFLNIASIPLAPKTAHVGQEIRVMGNNGGEKLSILSGTMAQLHREAPNYGLGEYNDFNTFYMQAASGTCAGSSGSPVLDLEGRAIALNCGGRSNASYYLPLDRIQRALDLIQQGQPVSRGTLYTEFRHCSFHELRQLGLEPSTEHDLRHAGYHGLLIVHATMPSHAVLEPGDILLEIDGMEIMDFVQLETLLDDYVGRPIELTVLRQGERITGLHMQVQDLHESMPHRFLELGGGIAHDVSYQVARSYGIPLNKGVYVSAAGYIFGTAYCLRRSIITSLNNQVVNNLDDLVSIVQRVPDGVHVPIRYQSLSNRKERVMVLHMDRRWHPMRLATRNDTLGLWQYKDLVPMHVDLLPSPPSTPPPSQVHAAHSIGTLKECIVAIDCYHPHIIDGLQDSHTYGAGLVISLDPPRVICDRDTIPVAMGAISLTLHCKVAVPASIVFMHPYYNFVILSFERIPDQVYYAPIQEDFRIWQLPKQGESVHYIGLDGVRSRECLIPRYRSVNVETIQLEQDMEGQGGVLATHDGFVLALWMSFATGEQETMFGQRRTTKMMGGLPVCYIAPCLEEYTTHALDVEFWTMQLANARQLGLPSSIQLEPEQQHVLYVMSKMDPSSPSAEALEVGDIVLEINHQPVKRLTDLTHYTKHEILEMTIYRNGRLMQITVPSTLYDGQETIRVIGWQGLLIQDAHLAAKEQACDKVPAGVYISSCAHGSPSQAVLKAGTWITAINGRKVHTLDTFLQQVRRINKDDHVRVKYVTKSNVANISVVRLDRHYWPTWLVEKDPESALGWQLHQGDLLVR
ncbi:hypothetical protein K492DRAFT_180165 [Lichtheimia hyalospora FSU 10163]|nr:hypothetical protein K492DRAFT_180165 [Lichtheimia hyalospora FSU 10163]